MFYPYQVKAKRIGLEKAYFTPKEALDFSVWEQDTAVKIPGRILDAAIWVHLRKNKE